MSNIKYINELFKKTQSLLLSQNIKANTREYNLKIKPSIAIIETLANEMDDSELCERIKQALLHISEDGYKLNLDTRMVKLQPDERLSTKNRLESDLHQYTVNLKKKVSNFGEYLSEDDKEMKRAESALIENYEKTKGNVKTLREVENDLSVTKYFVYAFLMFLLVFFVIRIC